MNKYVVALIAQTFECTVSTRYLKRHDISATMQLYLQSQYLTSFSNEMEKSPFFNQFTNASNNPQKCE